MKLDFLLKKIEIHHENKSRFKVIKTNVISLLYRFEKNQA